MGYWLKLYTEILDDPKVMMDMSDTGQNGMFFIFLIAKKIDNPCVGTIRDLIFHSRKSKEFWQNALVELIETGIVSESNGIYTVVNFEKRQEPIDGTERSKRSRQKTNAESMRSCNDSATNTQRNVTERREEKSREEAEAEIDQLLRLPVPKTPLEASDHPVLQIYSEIVGGGIPPLSEYQRVIDTLILLRKRFASFDLLIDYVRPFYISWSNRVSKNGNKYRVSNLAWLYDWALSDKSIPPEIKPDEPKTTLFVAPSGAAQ